MKNKDIDTGVPPLEAKPAEVVKVKRKPDPKKVPRVNDKLVGKDKKAYIRLASGGPQKVPMVGRLEVGQVIAIRLSEKGRFIANSLLRISLYEQVTVKEFEAWKKTVKAKAGIPPQGAQ